MRLQCHPRGERAALSEGFRSDGCAAASASLLFNGQCCSGGESKGAPIRRRASP